MKKEFLSCIVGACATVFFILTFTQIGFGKAISESEKRSPSISLDSPVSSLNLTQFMSLEATGALVLDTRSVKDFAEGYIPKSVFIGWNGPFKAWVPKILVNKDQPIILLSDQETVSQVCLILEELGYTHVLGYLEGGLRSYKKQYLLDSIVEVDASTYLDLSNEGQIIDVRSEKEFATGHIDNAMNFPLKDLGNFNLDLPDNKNYYVQCLSGYRSMIAMSILKNKGFEHVINIRGGYQALKQLKEEK